MSEKEEIRDGLSRNEYDKVGEMLLELINACPYTPPDLQGGIKYQAMSTERCIGVITLTGAKYVSRNVLGGFTAQVNFQIAYKSFPTTNQQNINAQGVVDNIMSWLEDLKNLPKLSGGRTITKITASSSFASVDEANQDESTVYVANAVMEYESD